MSFQIGLLGEYGVGKSTLLERYTGCEKSKHRDFFLKEVNLENESLNIHIWDLVQDKDFPPPPNYFRPCHGFLIIYDVNDELSFKMIDKWINYIFKYKSREIPIMIAGNKNDLEIVVDDETVKNYITQFNEKENLKHDIIFLENQICGYNDNIILVFETLIKKIHEVNHHLKKKQESIILEPSFSNKEIENEEEYYGCC
eukprot:TRINITY_DN3335_c0_g2_i1.p1 TRINITY_DN3335_c0_g2~~TRINITY_DN3335_c0_g2_i1.p1  ORF type:complete len:199 (+),score=39.77 TRINITY_DN3335_c0_g2_i1:224-820(+)